MPTDCSTIANPEERAHCILIQNRRAALAAVDLAVPEGLGEDLTTHLRNALTYRDHAIAALDCAARANAGTA